MVAIVNLPTFSSPILKMIDSPKFYPTNILRYTVQHKAWSLFTIDASNKLGYAKHTHAEDDTIAAPINIVIIITECMHVCLMQIRGLPAHISIPAGHGYMKYVQWAKKVLQYTSCR